LIAWLLIFTLAGIIAAFAALYLITAPVKSPELVKISIVAASILALLTLVLITPFIRWLRRGRNFRRFLFGVLCLVTLVALFYAEENFRGKWAWNHFKREWEAKGEKFDLASFIPPPVPDDQNFAMTPLFKPQFDFVRGTNGIEWRDTNGLERLRRVQPGQRPHGSTNAPPGFGSVERGKFTDLEAWQNFYRGNTNYPQPATAGTATADILVALGKFDSEFKELRDAAKTRPLSRFPIHYEEKPAFGILLPHLSQIKGLCQVFLLRAIARLELRQSEEALADLQMSFRLSDSIRGEPFLIDHLVRIATLSISLQGVREGLVRHAWNDEQLVVIEKHLASLDILAEYKQAMRSERACNLAGLEYFRGLGFRAPLAEFLYMNEEGGDQRAPGLLAGLNLMPSGWDYQNMITISRLHQDFTAAAVDAEKHRVFPEVAENMTNALQGLRATPFNIFAKTMMPALSRASMRSARIQASVDEARIACALERHRLANGKLPDSLDALAPRFIEKVPNDVINGQPHHYRVSPDGGYVIYSVGWNQRDDGGAIPASQDKNRVLDKSKDDWVWQLPAAD